jgi:tetratricopeptide (TPR) repeat protein
VFHYLRGDMARLGARSAAGLRASGGAVGELYANLGSALLAAGRLEAARACFALALEELPFYRASKREAYAQLVADLDRALATQGR